MEFNHEKYIYKNQFGSPSYWWQTVGPCGAVHFHCSLTEGYPPSAGLEFHHMTPPEYMGGQAPGHLDCPVIGGRCWHDGTSSYANEHIWPIVEGYLKRGEHEMVFKILRAEYKRVFEGE